MAAKIIARKLTRTGKMLILKAVIFAQSLRPFVKINDLLNCG